MSPLTALVILFGIGVAFTTVVGVLVGQAVISGLKQEPCRRLPNLRL